MDRGSTIGGEGRASPPPSGGGSYGVAGFGASGTSVSGAAAASSSASAAPPALASTALGYRGAVRSLVDKLVSVANSPLRTSSAATDRICWERIAAMAQLASALLTTPGAASWRDQANSEQQAAVAVLLAEQQQQTMATSPTSLAALLSAVWGTRIYREHACKQAGREVAAAGRSTLMPDATSTVATAIPAAAPAAAPAATVALAPAAAAPPVVEPAAADPVSIATSACTAAPAVALHGATSDTVTACASALDNTSSRVATSGISAASASVPSDPAAAPWPPVPEGGATSSCGASYLPGGSSGGGAAGVFEPAAPSGEAEAAAPPPTTGQQGEARGAKASIVGDPAASSATAPSAAPLATAPSATAPCAASSAGRCGLAGMANGFASSTASSTATSIKVLVDDGEGPGQALLSHLLEAAAMAVDTEPTAPPGLVRGGGGGASGSEETPLRNGTVPTAARPRPSLRILPAHAADQVSGQ